MPGTDPEGALRIIFAVYSTEAIERNKEAKRIEMERERRIRQERGIVDDAAKDDGDESDGSSAGSFM